MFVEYNDVLLQVIDSLQRFERVNVYTPDHADLLYTRHVLGFTATYVPGGMPALVSATRLSPDTLAVLSGADRTADALRRSARGADPGETAAILPVLLEPPVGARDPKDWRSGPETDAELKNRLLQPRKKLIVYAWGRQHGELIRWLESPRPYFKVDATTGPLPLSCDVAGVSGEPNAVTVFYQIQTDVAPCPTGSDRFVLSHRWEMTHAPDEDFYLSRVVEGEIVFHAGVRDFLGVIPDVVRNQMIHPIPLGFRRKPPVVRQSSDGLTIRYTVIDTDPTITFAAGDSGATSIEIQERHAFVKPGSLFDRTG